MAVYRPPPAAYDMPDLGKEGVLLLAIRMREVIWGGDNANEAARLRRLFVRLVDKAYMEYTLARHAMLRSTPSNPTSENIDETMAFAHMSYLRFTDEMENCLHTTRRLFRVFDAIKRNEVIDRTTRRFLEANSRGVRELRDLLEHIAEGIGGGEVRAGEPVILTFTRDGKGVCVGSVTVTFEQVATVLQAFCRAATECLSAHLNDPRPPPDITFE